jgi:uncharacterized damage-inducible protein DinB
MSQFIQPDQAAFILHTIFLPGIEREHTTTKAVIEAIPSTKGDYRPDSVSKTALELAWHIVAAEKRFLEGIVNGEFNFAPITRPESVKNGADIAGWYEQSFQSVLPRLRQLSGEQLAKNIDFRGIFQQPAVLYLQTAAHHSVHHRGQLSTYLRPMGGKVPAIYGESYDSAEAKKAAQAKSA